MTNSHTPAPRPCTLWGSTKTPKELADFLTRLPLPKSQKKMFDALLVALDDMSKSNMNMDAQIFIATSLERLLIND
jgi:hypothetical protein